MVTRTTTTATTATAATTILTKIQAYAQTNLRSIAAEFDKSENFPTEASEQLIAWDLLRLPISVEKGGLGGAAGDFLEAIRMISQEFAALGSIFLTQNCFGIWPMERFGTSMQKKKYFDQLVNGKLFGAFAFTEPQIGSNFDELSTTATFDSGSWIIQGEKSYISNATKAGIFYIVARIAASEDYGIFIVPAETAGVTIGPLEAKMGIRSLPVASLQLTNVSVPDCQLLGGKIAAKTQTESILNHIRLAIAAQAIGISQGAFERGLTYVRKDRKFGQRLIDLPTTQYKLAEISAAIATTQALLRQIMHEDIEDTLSVSMVKLKASDLAIATTETIIQVTGGYGYMRENDIERYVRDAKVTAVYGGSSETQKKIISRQFLARDDPE